MSTNTTNTTVPATYGTCKEVSAICPVSATILGYPPNLGSGYFFSIAFGLCLVASVVLSVRKRMWTYGVGIALGLLFETMGYIGRILLHHNPWDEGAFDLQITTIILGPTLICVSMYLTLKHVALTLNPALSRLQPKWYPRIFLPADLSCLIMQGLGGGIASAAGKNNTNLKLLDAGNQVIIAGVALQVVVLLVFGLFCADYCLRVRAYMGSPEAQCTEALRVWNDAKFRRFGLALSGAYFTILVRCIYRIAEMAGGWGNPIMQDQITFLILDSTLVLIAVFLLTVFHPGISFPQMCNGQGKKGETSRGYIASSSEGPFKVEGA